MGATEGQTFTMPLPSTGTAPLLAPKLRAAPGTAQGRQVRTLREAGRWFLRAPSAPVIAGALGLAGAARMRGGRPNRTDAVALGVVAGLRPFVEWGLHRYVLHVPPLTVRGRTFDVASGHRSHHKYPNDLNSAVLGRNEAFADLGMLALGVGGVAALVAGDRWRAVPTALLGTFVSLGIYEWGHLLMHTAYRPRSAWFRRRVADHRYHHWRDPDHAFGVTTSLGDRLFRTRPRRTATVRTLAATA